MTFLTDLMLSLRDFLGGNTEVGHLLAALALFWTLVWIDFGVGIAFPIAFFAGQEIRDVTRKLIHSVGGYNYWTGWVAAIPKALSKGDFTYPLAAVVLSAIAYTFFPMIF